MASKKTEARSPRTQNLENQRLGILFKASSAEERAGLVVSFDPKWEAPLCDGSVRAFIRKRFPSSFVPEFLYAYIKSPVSAIVLKAHIESIAPVSATQAIALRKELMLTKEEITRYCQGYERVGLFKVDSPKQLTPPLALAALRQNGSFFAPQSFFYLSSDGRAFIDRRFQV